MPIKITPENALAASAARRVKESAAEPVIVIQNYYTPYRHAWFEEIARSVSLLVVYIHLPHDEGRRWKRPETAKFSVYQCRHLAIGKLTLFWVPWRLIRNAKRVVLLDNNPSNICMMLWAAVFKLRGARRWLWVEHIRDGHKRRATMFYQRLCSKVLSHLSDRVLAFSEMTMEYLGSIGNSKPVFRMVQTIPTPQQVMRAPPEQPIRLGYIGSLDRRKNVELLIQVFSSLRLPNLELHLAGFERCTSIGQFEVPGDAKIIQHGYVSGVKKDVFFATIDVLILPSLSEPWGLVVNEAIYAQCVAAVSSRCASAELVARVDSQLVFEPDPIGVKGVIQFLSALPIAEHQRLRNRFSELIGDYSMATATAAFLHALED